MGEGLEEVVLKKVNKIRTKVKSDPTEAKNKFGIYCVRRTLDSNFVGKELLVVILSILYVLKNV